jgi:hypothetical protein
MIEHCFSHGPNVKPRKAELETLERVAESHGLTVVTYPALRALDPQWSFHGPSLGRFGELDLEDKVRADLEADPVFQAWCKREDGR